MYVFLSFFLQSANGAYFIRLIFSSDSEIANNLYFFSFVPFVLPYYGPDNTGEILDGNEKKTAIIFKQMQQHQQLRTWINGFLNSSLFMADVFIWFDIGCRTFHIINRLSFSTLIQLFQRLAIKSINMFGDYSFIFFVGFLLLFWYCCCCC